MLLAVVQGMKLREEKWCEVDVEFFQVVFMPPLAESLVAANMGRVPPAQLS